MVLITNSCQILLSNQFIACNARLIRIHLGPSIHCIHTGEGTDADCGHCEHGARCENSKIFVNVVDV